MLINVGAEFGKNLETSEIAIELVDILNKIPEEEFIIDFKDVMYVTMNYAVLLMRHAILNFYFFLN